MSVKNIRKNLTARLYSMIFKNIFPSICNEGKIGNEEYAKKVNSYIKHRKERSYDYSNCDYLKLKVDDNVYSQEFDCEVKENNFNNWINGTSSPKNLVIINSILEYTIEICRDESKFMLLKYEILSILKSAEFKEYVGDLIEPSISAWIERIEENDREALFKAVKEVMYLLKSRDKFSSYIIKEMQDSKEKLINTIQESSFEVVENSNERKSYKRVNFKYIVSLSALILISLAVWVNSSTGISKGSKKSNDSLRSIVLNNVPDAAISSERTPKSYTEQNVNDSVLSSGLQNKNTSENITKKTVLPPKITNPTDGYLLPSVSDITVKWERADSANSYKIAVTDTANWNYIFSRRDIKETYITLDKSLFKLGGHYRIYVHSTDGKEDSDPSYVDVATGALLPPKITSPVDKSVLNPASDVKVQWEPVASADSYKIVVTDTDCWNYIFSKEGIKDTSVILDKKLLRIGGHYRIYVHTEGGKNNSPPSYIDISTIKLSPTEIINPADGYVLPKATDIKLQWKPAVFADSYKIVVTDTDCWQYIYNKRGIKDNFIILDKSLFKPGGHYRIYLHTTVGEEDSAPCYIDISARK